MRATPSQEGLERRIKELEAREKLLSETERRFRTIFDNAMDGIYIVDAEKKKTRMVNPMLCRMLGYTQEEMKDVCVYDIHPPEDMPRVLEDFEKLRRGEVSLVLDIPVIRKDGSILFADISAARILLDNEACVAGIFRDITEHKRLEQELTEARNNLELKVKKRTAELQESENRYRGLVENAPVGIAELDIASGRILTANNMLASFTGYSKKELLGMSCLHLFVKSGRLQFQESLKALPGGRQILVKGEYQFLTKPGSLRWGETFTNLVFEDERPVRARTIIIDTTAKKEAEISVLRKEMELKMKSRELEETNKMLRELKTQSEQESEAVAQRILSNVEDLVLPYVRRLKEAISNPEQRVYLNVVEANLSEIMAPFSRKIGKKFGNLTAREIEVANLVRMGKTSAEISHLLSLSKRAVEFHRDRLRDKLGLKNKKQNLRAYLGSLQ